MCTGPARPAVPQWVLASLALGAHFVDHEDFGPVEHAQRHREAGAPRQLLDVRVRVLAKVDGVERGHAQIEHTEAEAILARGGALEVAELHEGTRKAVGGAAPDAEHLRELLRLRVSGRSPVKHARIARPRSSTRE